jgi:endonuclease YncB( thermonuclease family)
MRRLPLPSLLTLVAIGGLVAVACVPYVPSVPVASTAPACRVVNVVDGDTVDMTCPGEGRFRARLTGYDTPESFEPRCAAEAQVARAATTRLRGLVREAGSVDAQLGGRDRYDRRLVRLSLDGRDVGATLIAEGLALPYNGGPRPDWCARLG